MTAPLDGLDRLAPIADDDLAVLHARLARTAEREGILDVGYRTVDTPIGELLIAATDAGLVRVAFAIEGHDTVLDELARAIGARMLRDAARTDQVARELDEYFGGTRRSFDLPLDLRLARGFRRTVIEHLPDIPFGSTESYAQVAAASGSARAVRAVGTACALNPVPVVVPCHRVVRSDGALGRYRGGPQAKAALLALEADADR